MGPYPVIGLKDTIEVGIRLTLYSEFSHLLNVILRSRVQSSSLQGPTETHSQVTTAPPGAQAATLDMKGQLFFYPGVIANDASMMGSNRRTNKITCRNFKK